MTWDGFHISWDRYHIVYVIVDKTIQLSLHGWFPMMGIFATDRFRKAPPIRHHPQSSYYWMIVLWSLCRQVSGHYPHHCSCGNCQCAPATSSGSLHFDHRDGVHGSGVIREVSGILGVCSCTPCSRCATLREFMDSRVCVVLCICDCAGVVSRIVIDF
ncbi:hypothetical protein K439DRAFT_1517489 [Ramaria rubella]|nr:hypothetical protein K439DRAFT_1517489 [Ramaria rubella]